MQRESRRTRDGRDAITGETTPDVPAMAPLPVSVVVPTIGRVDLLARCLDSLAQARPAAGEVLVVDQSGDPAVARLALDFSTAEVRLITCDGHGAGCAVNLGLTAARYDTVLVTSDDCTVNSDWIGIAAGLMSPDSERLISGQVLPGGDPERTPSIRVDARPHSYAGRLAYDALSGNNLVLNRDRVLAIGGFDERMITAEDSDLCFRWLRSGGRIDYRPELLVTHHDWRTTAELERLYVDYWYGGGWFYGKHLRSGELRVIPLLLGDLRMAARGGVAGIVLGKARWRDPRRGFVRGFPKGLFRGLLAGRRAIEADPNRRE